MKILLFGKTLHLEDIEYVFNLITNFIGAGHLILMHKPYFDTCKNKLNISKDVKVINDYATLKQEDCDLLISLGGDGTLLRSATLVRELNIPILGINLGRLGFLSNLDKTDPVNVITLLEKGNYELDQRTLLKLETDSDIFGETKFALNDFTLLKRDSSSMITIHTYIDDEFLNSYWADGLIVSTPTGSTGYSLSCGGPIIFPSSKTFVITPVAPHSLTARPIIIPDHRKIRFEFQGRTDSFLCTLDSRVEHIDSSVSLALCKNDFQINLVRFKTQNFSKTIREKLNWGIDSRN